MGEGGGGGGGGIHMQPVNNSSSAPAVLVFRHGSSNTIMVNFVSM